MSSIDGCQGSCCLPAVNEEIAGAWTVAESVFLVAVVVVVVMDFLAETFFAAGGFFEGATLFFTPEGFLEELLVCMMSVCRGRV